MLSLTFLHAFFAFWTMISGLLVYINRDKDLWSESKIYLYLIPHLITAITGLFMRSSFEPISPFKVLSVITLFAFIRTVYLINKKEFVTSRRNMLGAYIGLTIAFVGTLHPERLFGDMLFGQYLNTGLDLALQIWIALMIVTSICGIIVGVLDKKGGVAKLI
jgi:uncharacterized membrane protein